MSIAFVCFGHTRISVAVMFNLPTGLANNIAAGTEGEEKAEKSVRSCMILPCVNPISQRLIGIDPFPSTWLISCQGQMRIAMGYDVL